MPLFEDPANFSKSRLKSDLIAHHVPLPPVKSKKEVYLELHLRHIGQKTAADFSSDEDDPVQDMPKKNKVFEDENALDPKFLTDDDLKAALLRLGITAGPIVASTRALYEKKLRGLLRVQRHDGIEENKAYSDSEEEAEYPEMAEQHFKRSYRSQQQSNQNGGLIYPQCFSISSRMRAHGPKSREPSPKRNLGNSVQSADRSQSHNSQIPAGISRASFVDQHSGLRPWVPIGQQSTLTNRCSPSPSKTFSIAQMVEEMESRGSYTDIERKLISSNVQEQRSRSTSLDMPLDGRDAIENKSFYITPQTYTSKYEKKVLVKCVNVMADTFPDAKASPTGIHVTARRPIKGAAGRPIQYVHPDTPMTPMSPPTPATPTSPATLERQEVERRLVPVYIQIFFFVFVVVVLYVISVFTEDGSLTNLLDHAGLWSYSGAWHSPQSETDDLSAPKELM